MGGKVGKGRGGRERAGRGREGFALSIPTFYFMAPPMRITAKEISRLHCNVVLCLGLYQPEELVD